MNLKSICCSLEWARKLKDAGVEQESLFYWMISERDKKPHLGNDFSWQEHGNGKYYSAFTTDELLEKLPERYKKGWLTCQKAGLWGVGYEYKHNIIISFEEKSLPNALAKMLQHLIKNKLWKGK